VRALARDPVRLAKVLAQAGREEGVDRDVRRGAQEGERPGHESAFQGEPPTTEEIEVIRGDVLSGQGLRQALQGVEVAYYLIHAMESSPKGAPQSSFMERERVGAVTFATAARRAGVARIVYLGGLLPRTGHRVPSRHLASRAEVQEILFEHVPDSVALRAAIVIGARSRSFRLLVRIVERLPVLALPPWRRFRTQPIDARDVIEMLLAAAVIPEMGGRALDIGGPEAVTYEEMLKGIAELLILSRPAVGIRVGMTPFTARIAAALAGEDPELVLPLMEGLEGDLLPAADHAAELLGVQLHSFGDAVEHALGDLEAIQPLVAR
jgi:uncharacterized protein YbjT (DUF2867 family)